MNLLDKLFINAFGIITLTVLFYLLTKVWIIGLFIAFLSWIFLRTAFFYFRGRRQVTSTLSVRRLEEIFAVRGISYQIDLLYATFPECFQPQKTENGIAFIREGKTCFLAPRYKFSPAGKEDIAKLYRDIQADKIYLLSRTPPREVFTLARSLFSDFSYVSSKEVKKYLVRHNALPETFPVPTRKKVSPKQILQESFSKEKAKYFFLVSFSFLFYCIFSPYKGWYIAFCVLNFLFGLLCVLPPIRNKQKK